MTAGPMQSVKPRYTIRPLSRDDLDEVLLIEMASFSHPWLREMFEAELDMGEMSMCFAAFPASETGRGGGNNAGICGYLMSWLVADELHINNLAVAPGQRRSGAAKELLSHALKEAARKGAVWCQLEARASNAPARRLYEKFGFVGIGIRGNYYQDGEDAVVMGKTL
ncbi:MAG: ribosomal protein S18-alanine N-acetyltransferase [Proteobacteria bacterium]|nr:ribosomal protein S18-alanine N-acetyltransferase [Pseudomonadota bacterium]